MTRPVMLITSDTATCLTFVSIMSREGYSAAADTDGVLIIPAIVVSPPDGWRDNAWSTRAPRS